MARVNGAAVYMRPSCVACSFTKTTPRSWVAFYGNVFSSNVSMQMQFCLQQMFKCKCNHLFSLQQLPRLIQTVGKVAIFLIILVRLGPNRLRVAQLLWLHLR